MWTSSLILMQIIYAYSEMKNDDWRRIWYSKDGGYEELYILLYNDIQPVTSQPTVWRNMSPSSTESKKPRDNHLKEWKISGFQGGVYEEWLLVGTRTGELGTTLAVTSNRSTLRKNTVTLMMKAICSLVLTRATRRNIPEDGLLRLEKGSKQSSARVHSSETSVDTQRTTWRYMAEDSAAWV
jgi:hypothetical protein